MCSRSPCLPEEIRHPRRMTHTRARHLSPHDLRRVAVLAGCDPRSVQRALDGLPLRSTTHARIWAALRDLHLCSDSAHVSLASPAR